MLVQARLSVVEGGIGFRVESPADSASVQVEDVEDFAAGVQNPKLHRIAEIAVRRDGGRVAEGIRAVRLGFLLGSKVETVHERLGAIVHRARARPIGLGERVDFRQPAPTLIEHVFALVADLVIELDVLAEGGLTVAGDDDRLPTGIQGWSHARVDAVGAGHLLFQVARAGRLDNQCAEQTMVGGGAIARTGVRMMRALLIRIVRHPVAIQRAGAARHVGWRVCTHGVAGGANLKSQSVDVYTEAGAGGIVGEGDFDTIALVRADDQRLNGVIA